LDKTYSEQRREIHSVTVTPKLRLLKRRFKIIVRSTLNAKLSDVQTSILFLKGERLETSVNIIQFGSADSKENT
jgi:hypothetical protein